MKSLDSGAVKSMDCGVKCLNLITALLLAFYFKKSASLLVSDTHKG